MLSNGEHIRNPKPYIKAEEKLARLQREHSRKQKGSKNREKARLRVARQHEKVANQRKALLDKLSWRLINENQGTHVHGNVLSAEQNITAMRTQP